MTPIPQARLELLAALRTVEGLHVHGDPGATVDPPAALIGIPAVGWRAYVREPTSATWVVMLVADANEHATTTLAGLLGPVVEAIETAMPNASVQNGPAAAMPGTWHAGGVELPAWQITVEVAL